jgi:quinoprotein glucose dehydrogenase
MFGTRGLAFAASGLTFIAAATDRYFRAFETATGKELWRVSLPAAGQSMPMTYRMDSNGKQFGVLAAGGHSALHNKQGDYLIAYALP